MPSKPDKKGIDELKNVLGKIHRGDGITDPELQMGLEFLRELEWRLDLLCPEYQLAWKDVYMRLQVLEGFDRSRREKF